MDYDDHHHHHHRHHHRHIFIYRIIPNVRRFIRAIIKTAHLHCANSARCSNQKKRKKEALKKYTRRSYIAESDDVTFNFMFAHV